MKDTKTKWDVAYITVRDQVFMPLVQGMLWSLAISGWRYWNRGAALRGQGIGARMRRWWWSFNDWALPEDLRGPVNDDGLAKEIGSVSRGAPIYLHYTAIAALFWVSAGVHRG